MSTSNPRTCRPRRGLLRALALPDVLARGVEVAVGLVDAAVGLVDAAVLVPAGLAPQPDVPSPPSANATFAGALTVGSNCFAT